MTGNDSAWIDIGWVDLAMAVFLALSVAIGLFRGFVFELMSLAGWFVAYFVSLLGAPVLLPHVHVGPPGSALNQVVAVVSVFVVAMILWGLLARLLRALIRGTPLSGADRLLGAAFGSLRGLLVLTILTLIVGVTPWARSEAWQQSRAAPWLGVVAAQIRPFLPFDVHQTPTQGGSYVRHRWRDLQKPGQSADL